MFEDPLLGQQLGNYRIERLLGRGGMAQVYYGWDLSLERPVALKVIDARYRDSPGYAARFVREARAVATWRHENIVQIYYADEQSGLYYFAMEYIEGLDLRELANQYATEGTLMPHDDVIRLGQAMADALDYAHEKGVIHRDVKPSNVMISKEERIVLTDFGLAMDIYQGSVGEVFGSPHYIAPEQARSSAAAVPQSDLYALGVILYELLTGVVPFDDPSTTTVALQHITQPPPPPRDINPDLNAETEAVLLKALDKNPDARYATGAALIEALKTALQVAGARAPAVDLPPPPPGVAAPGAPAISQLSIHDKVTSHLQAHTPNADQIAKPQQEETDLIGQQLDEYRLESLLGHGGMARIYRALDVRLNRHVAIKIIDTPFRADADYLMRFEREAQAIARLEHAHIVRLYRYGEAQGLLYMAMQYVDGADLADVLESYHQAGEFIEPHHAQRIIQEICEALDYAHSQGIIHRDIKPANILIDQQDHAILTDFGLALLTEAGTRGVIFGSPHYIAPEQAISSANVVPQSDLYALGVILYEMFTGQVPFEAENALDLAMLHMTETPTPPRAVRPDLDPGIEAVILKAMAKEPKDRYATGQDLADALTHALSSQTAPAIETQPTLYERGSLMQQPSSIPSPPQPLPAAAPSTTPPASEEITPQTKAPRPQPPPPKQKRLSPINLVLVAGLLLTLLAGAIYLGTRIASPQETPTITAKTPQTEKPNATSVLTPLPEKENEDVQATPMQKSTEAPSTPTNTSSPVINTNLPENYNLLFAYENDDGLFIVNQGTTNFPLAQLSIRRDNEQISGEVWGLTTLAPGTCVIWGRKENPKSPKGLTCELLDIHLEEYKGRPFWREGFDVYHQETELGECAKDEHECPLSPTDQADIVPTPTSASTSAASADLPETYTLFFVYKDDDSLFVVNQGPTDFPLAQLSIRRKDEQISGDIWGLSTLAPNTCVVWGRKEEPKFPKDLTCDLVNTHREDYKGKPFWREDFEVYFQEMYLGECTKKDKCTLSQPE